MSRALLLLPLLVGCDQEFDVQAFQAELEITPEVTDLGAVAVGSTTEFGIMAVHIEGPDLEILDVEVLNIEGEAFSFVGEPTTLEVDGMAELDFLYAPQDLGYHYAEVTVVSEAVEERMTVVVRGQAAEAAASLFPPLVDFGPVATHDTGTAVLYLNNDGQVTIELASVQTDPGGFSVISSLPLQVPVGQQAPVQLAYTAADELPVMGSARLILTQASIDLDPVVLVANDCEHGDATLYDQDGDGYALCGTDCDDLEATTHPGATEWYDGVDQDCDGIIDEGTEGYDDDGDGFTELDGDCNDGDVAVYPGAPEDYGNGVDDDCDGSVDSNFSDLDGDGYAPEGGDCDDTDAGANPGEVESLDGVDNDCDGTVDEDTDGYDDDGDGFTEAAGDCDDDDPTSYPTAPELADWTDNDCDGQLDEGTVNADDDGDGYTEVGGDCDDGNARVNPAALETFGDGVDNDCDGVIQ
jgi:hypothetical protein